MLEIDEAIRIDAPPETVFEVIADPHNHVLFTPSVAEITNVEETDVGKRGEYTFEIAGVRTHGTFEDTAVDPPAERAYDLEGDFTGRIRWSIEGTDGGSRVAFRSETDLPGPDLFDAVTEPVARRFLRREATSLLENLKALVEEGEAVAELGA